MAVSLSVIFITLNEEFHIGNAIDNVKGIAADVFVVDSGSSDKTVEIAVSKGANVLFHPFEGFGKQWNWALDNCPVKTDWTMKMDPDERLSVSLKEELQLAISRNEGDGFYFDRILWFMGKELPGVRNEVLRVWRTGNCRFTDVSVNEYPQVRGRLVHLKNVMAHHDTRDLFKWFEKQNRYTSQEALIRYHSSQFAVPPSLFGDGLQRRMWFKKWFFSLPFRYTIWLWYCYLCLGAWRAGRVGWYWAQMRVVTMRLTEYKWREMQMTGRDVSQR